MHEIIKKLRIVLLMTIFVLSFLLIFSVIYLKIPSDKEVSSSNAEGVKFDIDGGSIKYEKNENILVEGTDKVKVYDEGSSKVIELGIEDYVIGVLAGEVPANFCEEALKAQAVAARTYYLSKRENPCKIAKEHGAEICVSTHCQVYMSKEERFSKWSKSSAEENWNKISSAVMATAGQVLTYEDELVKDPKYFAVSAGKTENSIDVFADDVPYLKSTDSPGEERAPKYMTTVEIKKNEFINKVNSAYSEAKIDDSNISNTTIISRTDGEGVKEIRLGNIVIDGVKFRQLFNLNSTDFNIKIDTNAVNIECKGYGHRVGMSQWGANAMASDGKNYEEILKHYYTGVNITKVEFEK
ncbi:stage II sporulation protein D [Clostridium sp. DSM 8431]|uniref:stage II sporulation protein D n=1 Tax=Clostridium sp. DSM 8431 TaxID=1761781 RepID=UPI0008EFEA9E|nr:stage II sporulation protein D [Clostridium sp. DSM 8431]SFU78721.1 stage II sporulation protein D [Clostridium sp. DSM 8431]